MRHLYEIRDRVESTTDKTYSLARQLCESEDYLETVNSRIQTVELGQARLDGQLVSAADITPARDSATSAVLGASASQSTWAGSRYGLSKPT